jgi:hypothetical protein
MKKSKQIVLAIVATVTMASCAPKKQKNQTSVMRSNTNSTDSLRYTRSGNGFFPYYWMYMNGGRYNTHGRSWYSSKSSYKNYHPNISTNRSGFNSSSKTTSVSSKGGFGSSGHGSSSS